jgi:hypothetical protein
LFKTFLRLVFLESHPATAWKNYDGAAVTVPTLRNCSHLFLYYNMLLHGKMSSIPLYEEKDLKRNVSSFVSML